MLQEFKAFAIKGNVIDLAVGVTLAGHLARSSTHWWAT